MNWKHFDLIADKTIATFPNEEKTTYFAKPRTLNPYQNYSRGKIRNLYYKTVVIYREKGLIPKEKTKKKNAVGRSRDYRFAKRAKYDDVEEPGNIFLIKLMYSKLFHNF